MTREEIINEIKCLLSELNNGEDAVSYLTQNDVKWLNENIKALEQEPVLDKIRAEIVDITKCPYGTQCLKEDIKDWCLYHIEQEEE